MFTKPLLASSLLAAGAFAQTAQVIIEASHGGAGRNLRNTTVQVPVNTIYTNASAFDEISTLYLTSADGVPVESITCTPYRDVNGTGMAGESFMFSEPSLLSTNTVGIGSMQCVTRGRVDDTAPNPAVSGTMSTPPIITEVPGGLPQGPAQTVVDGTTTFAGVGTTFPTATPTSSTGGTGETEEDGASTATTMMSSTTAVASTSETEPAAPEQQTDGAAGHVTPASGLTAVLVAALGLGLAL
ncbi:hypothetical protein MBLNU230_g5631t1 [Neophaeotheca triangularis]